MDTGSMTIGSLIERLGSGEIRLPEIQREYVWKPPKIASLVDSLYRGYPTGSLLLWESDNAPKERAAAIDGQGSQPLVKPIYLLDGQQRLTSLHRVFSDHERAQIVFNVATERFQNQSVATKKDARWLKVVDALNARNALTIVQQLSEKLPDLDPGDIQDRISRLLAIREKRYHVEVLRDVPYKEVAEIFVRINSGGRPLKASDLALATLSARWAGVVDRFDAVRNQYQDAGYSGIGTTFLVRALAAAITEAGISAGYAAFAEAPDEVLEDGWETVQRGLTHLIPLLKQNADVATSDLLPSVPALTPLVVYLGRRPEAPLDSADANALIYWLLGAFIGMRYSGSTTTVLDQDLAAIRQDEPIKALMDGLGIGRGRLQVRPEHLAGRSTRSPYFLLSYLAARKAGAKDWYYAIDICTDGPGGRFALEYHHIHPRARLRDAYKKSQINDLANLAFISAKANNKIKSRSPEDYFVEIGDEQLAAHFVPLDKELRQGENYPAFLEARRSLLASAMTEVLESFRPVWLDEMAAASDPTVGEQLSFTLYGDRSDDSDAVLFVEAAREREAWRGTISVPALRAALDEFEDGVATELEVMGEVMTLDPDEEAIALLLGPLEVVGTAEDWRDVLRREEGDRQRLSELPAADARPWEGARARFPVTSGD